MKKLMFMLIVSVILLAACGGNDSDVFVSHADNPAEQTFTPPLERDMPAVADYEPEPAVSEQENALAAAESPLVGIWQHETENYSVEFHANGNGITWYEGEADAFAWFADGMDLTIAYPGEAPETGQFFIVDNILTLSEGGHAEIFVRAGDAPHVAAPAAHSTLVGTWRQGDGYTVEFFADETGIARFDGESETFAWLAEGMNLTLTYPGEAPETGQFSIVGDILTVTHGRHTETLTRVN